MPAHAESAAPESSSNQNNQPKPDLSMQELAQGRNADQLSLAEARAVLDKDHYGLDKVLMCCCDDSLLHRNTILCCISVAIKQLLCQCLHCEGLGPVGGMIFLG